MANSNVNIASKLYAYIRHGIDINDNIKDVYRNSMIFIGDEQQIYVPVMDTYVGIGMTSYNNTLNRISYLEGRINEVAETLSSDLVSKLYANYSYTDLTFNSYINATDKGQSLAAFNEGGEEFWQLNNEVTIRGINDYDPETGFARTIEHPYIVVDSDGNEYRLNQAAPYGNGLEYQVDVSSGNVAYNASGLYVNYNDGETYTKMPTSGIKVTPVWGGITSVENPITHQPIAKRIGNRLEIDDSLTWSYMTSAYAYTLNYSQLYTNSEIERVYHNLLGEPTAIYVPVSFDSVVDDVTTEFNKLSIQDQERYAAENNVITWPAVATVANGAQTEAGNATIDGVTTAWLTYNTYTVVYKVKSGDYYWSAYSSDINYEIASLKDGNLAYTPFSVAQISSLLDEDQANNAGFEAVADTDEYTATSAFITSYGPSSYSLMRYTDSFVANFPQIYIKDTQYNSTYNMNIKDGIETLKEVAYLLDILSDGTLGSTTYVTYGDWSAAYWDVTDPDNPVANTGWEGPTTTTDHVGNTVVTYTYDGVTYTVLQKMDGVTSPKASDLYVFYTNTGADAENLGIQIAYSIAGNKKEIDDLHSHTDLLEEGKTTLRSIQSTSNDFAEVKLVGGTTHWVDTDSNQGESDFGNEDVLPENRHPNYETSDRNAYNSYLVGDVNIQVHLNTAKVYTTTYTAGVDPINYYFKDDFDVVWFGAYTMADMNNLPETPNTTYYEIGNPTIIHKDASDPTTVTLAQADAALNDSNTDYIKAEFTEVTNLEYQYDPRLQTVGTQYWYKPEAALALNNNEQNIKYASWTVEDYLGLADGDPVNSANLPKTGNYDVYYKDSSDTAEPYKKYSSFDSEANGKVAFENEWNTQNNDPQNFSGDHELSLDEKIYIIDSGLINQEKVKVHAVIGENALATTEWVGAYVDSVVEDITEELENILEEAKQYTRDQIAKLDKDYKYSDFNSYWTNFLNNLSEPYAWGTESGQTYSVAAVTQAGSPEYKSAYEIEYNRYQNNPYVFTYENSGDYRLSYITNSQYVYNTVEEDGIVTPETRELPTDELTVKTRVWGDEQNEGANASHTYEDVVINNTLDSDNSGSVDQPDEANGSDNPLFMAIYNWMATAKNATPSDDSDDFEDNQLFVADGVTYKPLPVDSTSKEAIDTWRSSLTPSTYYYFNYETQEFADLVLYMSSLVGEEVHGNQVVFNYGNRDDKFWTLVYEQVPNYVEINLQKAETDTVTSTNLKDSLKIENEDGTFYVLTKHDTTSATTVIDVTKVESDGTTAVSGFTATTLKYIDKKATEKVEYLTVENHHYSYLENGNGENKFEVTAHITKLEDATASNTGFADAFDVQTYVKNFFAWVDISASVTDSIINSFDIYYKEITLSDYLAMADAPTLYQRTVSNDEVQYNSVNTPNTSWYWQDNNALASEHVNTDPDTLVNGGTASNVTVNFEAGTSSGNDLVKAEYGEHIKINLQVSGGWFHKQFNANGGSKYEENKRTGSNYYIRIEEPKLNPLNLTLTEYGK